MFHDFAHKLLTELIHENAAQQKSESGSRALLEETEAIPEIGSNFTIEIDDVEITISDQSPGIYLFSNIGSLPLEKQEEFFATMLRGNFLGQATRNASLGIDEAGQNAVLVRQVETTGNYRDFKDAVEDFVNAACFWKARLDEAKK